MGNQAAAAPPAVATDPLGALHQVREMLDQLATVCWTEQSGAAIHQAIDVLEQVRRRQHAISTQLVATAEAEGLWALDGQRTFAAWLAARTATTKAGASRTVRESRALRDHLPAARQALAQGRIGPEHVGAMAREATRTARLRNQLGDAEVGEDFLVRQAQDLDAGRFGQLVKAWSQAADPDGADRAWREDDAKEELTLAATTGGWHLHGWLDDASGQLLSQALAAHLGRRTRDDQRTSAQRRAAALTGLAQQSLDAGQQGASARIRPHLTILCPLPTLQALAAATGSAIPPGTPEAAGRQAGPAGHTTLLATGGPRSHDREHERTGGSSEGATVRSVPETRWAQAWRPGDDHVIATALDHEVLAGLEPATLSDGTPIPPGMLARFACESQLSRVIFGPGSTVLDVGREKRIFPAHHARAVIARDRHCRYPGCHEPPEFGEIHHSLWWSRHQGRTSVAQGILLCYHHHDWVHTHEITISHRDDSWHFTDRHGRAITADGPAGPADLVTARADGLSTSPRAPGLPREPGSAGGPGGPGPAPPAPSTPPEAVPAQSTPPRAVPAPSTPPGPAPPASSGPVPDGAEPADGPDPPTGPG